MGMGELRFWVVGDVTERVVMAEDWGSKGWRRRTGVEEEERASEDVGEKMRALMVKWVKMGSWVLILFIF